MIGSRAVGGSQSCAPPYQAILAIVCFAIGLAACTDGETQKLRHFDQGQRYLSAGKHREAILELRNAVAIDARFGAARAKLAEAYAAQGDGANALSEYVRAADLLPNDLSLQLSTGSYLLAARRVSDALARADAVLSIDPKNIEAHILRGNALGGLDRLEDALAEMEEALRLDPARGATYTHLGLVESARGQADAAEAAFKRAVELEPANVGSHLALANFYWATGRLADAEKALEGASALDPDDQGTNRALAVFSLATGRIGQAEKYLKRIADLSAAPSSIFALAEYYIATRRSTDAITLLEPLAGASRVAGAKHRLARAYAASGNMTAAHSLIEEILASAPGDTDALLLKAQMLLDARRGDEAFGILKRAVAADPRAIGAQFTLGKVHAARGDILGADAAFREVLRHNPSAVAARVELSLLGLAAGTARASLSDAEEAVARQPRNIAARLALVRGMLASQQFDRAERELQVLHAALPNAATVHVQLGVLAASRNQGPAARAAFNRALDLDADSVEALAGLVALELNAANFQAAKDRVTHAVAKPTVGPEVLLLAARTYGSVKDFAAAERVLRRAIDSNSALLPAYSMLAEAYVAQGKLESAQREFDNLAERQSSPIGALTMSGLILQALGRPDLARDRYEQAVRIDVRAAAVAANNLAWMYADDGERLPEALRLAHAAADALPEAPEVWDTLGWVYFRNDLPVMALTPLTRAVERSPKNATYHYHLGMALAKAGDPARGRAALARALELSGDAEWRDEARRILSELAANAGA